MDFLAVLTSAIGLVGGVAGLISLYIQRKQAQLLQAQIDREFSRDVSMREWAHKYDQAVALLNRIMPRMIATAHSKYEPAYDLVFGDAKLQQSIERSLGRRSAFFNRFVPKTLTNDDFLNPVVQDAIRSVLDKAE